MLSVMDGKILLWRVRHCGILVVEILVVAFDNSGAEVYTLRPVQL